MSLCQKLNEFFRPYLGRCFENEAPNVFGVGYECSVIHLTGLSAGGKYNKNSRTETNTNSGAFPSPTGGTTRTKAESSARGPPFVQRFRALL